MKTKTANYIFCALFTAIICISAQIILPMPSGVPITLQTLAVCLCGYTLNTKYAALSVITYLFLGLLGVPVFSFFSGGPAILFGKNGGFLFGFVILATCCSAIKYQKILRIVMGIIGVLICHFFGVLQFSFVFGSPFLSSFVLISIPTLLKDFVCVLASFFISEIISHRLKFN